MNYETLPLEAQAQLLRAHLLQAESDHFVHTLQADEARVELQSVPKGEDQDERRALLQTAVDQLETLAATAESKADVVKGKLDELSQPYVEPTPPTPEPTTDVQAEGEALADHARSMADN